MGEDYKVTNEDWAYIAGFFDGEGSVGIRGSMDHQDRANSPHLCIAQKDPAILEWIRDKSGMGVVRKKMSVRDQALTSHQLNISKRIDVRAFCEAILPYVKVKRTQIELLIFFMKLPDRRYSGVDSEAIRIQKLEIYQRMKDLKKVPLVIEEVHND